MTEEKQKNNDKAEKSKKEIPLFRDEAMKHRKGSFLGKALIITPVSFSIWALGLFLIASILGLYLYFGTYSKRQEVSGMLVPSKGLINVYAEGNSGVVAEIFVKHGEKVAKDQLLYLISTERHTLTEQGAFAQQVELLEKQLKVKKNQLEIYKKNIERYKELLDKRVVSETEYQDARYKYLHAKSEYHKMEQELINTKGASDYAVRSPANGTISNLVAMIGDRVTRERPLASIIPKGAVLQGILFVPSSAIGFVKIGQKVLLKYDAYPYQNFGLYESTVSHIDKSVLFPKDIDMPVPVGENPQLFHQKPFYRVFVTLKQPYVIVYGKPYPLKPGTTLQGSMLGDKRNIWQWILDPIYSLRGSLTSS